MCSLRDVVEDFEDLGVDVYGLSLDDVASMAKFAEQQELNFMLLSDPDGSVGAKYDVLPEAARWTKRVTFVIDDKGVLRHVDGKVNVDSHGSDLLELVAEMKLK